MPILRGVLGKVPSGPRARVRNFIANKQLGTQSDIHENVISPGVTIPWHFHETEEVIVVLEGNGECTTDEGTETFSAGDVIIFPAGLKHSLRNSGDTLIRQICFFPSDPATRFLEEEYPGQTVDVFNASEWASPKQHDPTLPAVLDRFFAAYYRRHPVSATFIGVHQHDARLPDYSERGLSDAVAEVESLQAGLRGVAPEPLSEGEALDRALVEGWLEIQRWERASPHFVYQNPAVYTGEAVFGVIALFLRDFAPPAERVDAAVARMHAIPVLLAQGRANVRRAPRAWIDRAIRDCAGADAFFQDGVETLIAELRLSDGKVRAGAAVACAAFAEFRAYLETELRPNAHDDYACGEEAFELLLRHGHFLETDAASIRRSAEERLAACEGELQARARACGAATWREALAQLADRHPPVERYYARYGEVWEEARAAATARDLVTWPEYPIRYVPQPRWARRVAPYLYFLPYRSPAPYDRAAVVEYLVPPVDQSMPPDEQRGRLRAANDSVIKLNHVIHHGGIGHHIQNWYAYRADSRVGRIAAVDCASRIALFCGGTMAEGWACYATDLMEEIGFLTPLERCAQLYGRFRMAARAYVDIELHHAGLTLDEAAALYQHRIGLAPEAARAEAVKNSMFPGTAMMYMMGTDLIHGLRRELAARPGFDLRRFHDRLLAFGSVPVSLAAAAMRESEIAVRRPAGEA